MIKCLVTGASGFIGSHMVDLLLAKGHEVIGVDNLSGGQIENLDQAQQHVNFEFIEGSVTDQSLMESLCNKVDAVIHLAALADIVPSIEQPEAYYRSNVDGTYTIVEEARKAGIQKFVYAASSSCYGMTNTYPTPENEPMSPMYPYALTKMLGEEIVLHWAKTYNFPAISLRFFNVFGPRARTSGSYGAVFGVFLAQKLAGLPYTVVGDGEQSRDFTYVSDIVDAIYCALKSDVNGQAMNIGSGGTYSINKLVSLLGGEIKYIPKRPGEPDCTYADISKVQKLLGWKPKVSFEEGVKSLLQEIDSFKEAPVWTPESIDQATETWFKYLSPKQEGND